MRNILRFAAVGTSLTALIGIGVASPAGATPPTGYGFDNTAHVIVGGGSDTTYNAMNKITTLWDASLGCPTNTGAVAAPPVANTCVTNASPETNSLGNYQHDTVAQAFPTGSSTGIASLNNFPAGIQYAGTVNAPGPNVDFARSSREPITTSPFTSSKCAAATNELQCDTWWGYAQDGIELMGFNNNLAGTQRGTQLGNDATGLTPTEIYNIYNCTYTTWSQVPSLGIAAGGPDDGPIVAWGMNPASGTYGAFNSYLISTGAAPAGWAADGQTCVHKLTTGIYPFENDIKPIFNDVQANGMLAAGAQAAAPAPITTGATDLTNPNNWIWFGSGGVLNSYPYTSNYTIGPGSYSALASNVNGTAYSAANVLSRSYPIGRTLFHVTRKTDADCPVAAGAPPFGRPCAFTANPGPAYPAHDGFAAGTDLNVTGGASGISGAVREFTRFICRSTVGQDTKDTLTGASLFTEFQGAVKADGFTVVPGALRSPGSSCKVES